MTDSAAGSGDPNGTSRLARTGTGVETVLSGVMLAIGAIEDPIAVVEPGGLLACNPALLSILGVGSVDEAVARTPTLLAEQAAVELGSGTALTTPAAMRSLAHARHRGPWTIELRRADRGTRAACRATAHPLGLPGHPDASLINLADITDLRSALADAHEQATLVGLAGDAILALGENGVIIRWLGGCERTYGWTAAEAVGRTVVDLLHPDPPELVDAIRAALESADGWFGRVTVSTKSGRRIVVESRQAFARDIAGRVGAVVIVDREIGEDTLRREEAETLTATVSAAAPIGVEVFGPNGTVTHMNDAMARFLGLPSADVAIGRANILTDQHYAGTPLQAAFLRAFAGEIVHLADTSDRLGDPGLWSGRGDPRHLEITIWPIVRLGGEVARVVAIGDDITDRIRAEEERRVTAELLHRAERLEGLALLAGGVAHDLNNILAPIVGNASLLEERFRPGTEGHDLAVAIRDAGVRGAALARWMMAYAGRTSIEPVAIDLAAALTEMRPLLAAAVPTGIETRLELSRVGAIEFDPTQLQQVILNLVANAAEAMGETGTLTIGARRRRRGAANGGDGAPLQRVVIEVADTGGGMGPEALARLFEPFYSTKGPGRGLGLAAVAGIVRAHGGTISAASTPGAGTTVSIVLPALPGGVAPPVEQVPTADGSAAPAATTILVVDDEPAIRRFVRTVLGRAGHTVLEADDEPSAIEVFVAERGRIGAVLCDLTLPRGNGGNVARAINALEPDIPVIIMSGWSEDSDAMPGDTQVAGRLQKPFTPRDLVARVADALATCGPRSTRG